MSSSVIVLPPSPSLAQDVMGYVVRRRPENMPREAPAFRTHFPANLYAALTIVHGGTLVDPASGLRTPPLSFSGAMTQGVSRDYIDAPETTVVLFKPGRLTDVLRLPAGEFTDRWHDGDALLSAQERSEIADRMASQRTVARQLHVLEGLLERRLRRKSPSRASVLARFVQQLVWRLPHMTVRELAEHTQMHERRLHRHFIDTFGVPPKVVIRLARLQLSLLHVQAAARQTTASMASVAQASGFADASHMARDFRSLIGQTPAMLRDRMARSAPSEWAFDLPQDLLHPLS
jgi:AraC-like DNA-binding protein